MVKPNQVIKSLGLKPLKIEGGFFVRTFTSQMRIPGRRKAATCIYYLVTQKSFSRLHRVKSTECYFFHAGDPITLVIMDSVNKVRTITLGPVIGRHRQFMTVPKNRWQSLQIKPRHQKLGWSLVSALAIPGFQYSDFQIADAGIMARLKRHRRLLSNKI